MMQNLPPELLLRMTHLEDVQREQKAVRQAQQTRGLRRRHHRRTR